MKLLALIFMMKNAYEEEQEDILCKNIFISA